MAKFHNMKKENTGIHQNTVEFGFNPETCEELPDKFYSIPGDVVVAPVELDSWSYDFSSFVLHYLLGWCN